MQLAVLFFFSSELAGVTPHTVQCNISKELFIIQLAVQFFFSSELAGVTPHTVRCYISKELFIMQLAVLFFFFHLNWRVSRLIQFDVTFQKYYLSYSLQFNFFFFI